jgi:two-component sensor histidine kinase
LDEEGRPSGALGVLLDITERKEAEEHRQFLVSELQHRTKNLLGLVRAIAVQTFREETRAETLQSFNDRLAALGKAHELLHQEHSRTELRAIVEGALEPHGFADGRFDVAGPDLLLSPRQALSMSLALNELATNAAKYGALCDANGRVRIRWERAEAAGGAQLRFTWTESGGPRVRTPSRRGFGTRLVHDQLPADLGGTAVLDYQAGGFVYELTAPWPHAAG